MYGDRGPVSGGGEGMITTDVLSVCQELARRPWYSRLFIYTELWACGLLPWRDYLAILAAMASA